LKDLTNTKTIGYNGDKMENTNTKIHETLLAKLDEEIQISLQQEAAAREEERLNDERRKQASLQKAVAALGDYHTLFDITEVDRHDHYECVAKYGGLSSFRMDVAKVPPRFSVGGLSGDFFEVLRRARELAVKEEQRQKDRDAETARVSEEERKNAEMRSAYLSKCEKILERNLQKLDLVRERFNTQREIFILSYSCGSCLHDPYDDSITDYCCGTARTYCSEPDGDGFYTLLDGRRVKFANIVSIESKHVSPFDNDFHLLSCNAVARLTFENVQDIVVFCWESEKAECDTFIAALGGFETTPTIAEFRRAWLGIDNQEGTEV